MKKTTVWEFTDEELEVLTTALSNYETALVADDDEIWDAKKYTIAAELNANFRGELYG